MKLCIRRFFCWKVRGSFVVLMAGQELNSKSIADVTYEREGEGYVTIFT
jgi:hypothetical protein